MFRWIQDKLRKLNSFWKPFQSAKRTRQERILLPPGAFDTHVHVFDSQVGPFHPTRAYTPAEAPLPGLLQFVSNLSITGKPANVVLVQPSPYRSDNTVLLSTLRTLQSGETATVRGIAVVDLETVTDNELQEMHRLGVRGIRLNLQADGHSVEVEGLSKMLRLAAERISSLPNWRVQIFCPAIELQSTIAALPCEVIADHLGGLLGVSKLGDSQDFEDALSQRGFRNLIQLAKDSRILIKISGLYRASARAQETYDDLEPIIRELARQVPDRLIWASDWPHTGEGKDRARDGLSSGQQKVEKFRVIDNHGILERVRSWIGSEENWQKLMVDNPSRAFA